MMLEEIKAAKKYALNGGPFGSKLVTKDYVPTGVPVIRGTNLSKGTYFSFKDLVFVSEEKANELKPNNAHPGDIIFTQRGTLGQIGIIPKGSKYDRFVISQSQMKLTVDETKADAYFVYYYFKSSNTIQRIKNLAFSSGVPHINLQVLREFEIDLPPLPTQRKIASILSAYDDLIENNTRRIKILEELAQALYREWFVHFRFPGHEKVRMVDSKLGRIPEGWNWIKVGKLLKKIRRPVKIYNKEYVSDGMIPVIDQGREFIGGYTDNLDSQISNDLPVIVFGDHTRALKFINFPFACGADGTQLLKSNNERMPMTLFYYALLSIGLSDFTYARHFKFLKEEPILLPSISISDLFDQFVSPLLDQIMNLMERNKNLLQTRNLLLLRLISGELEIKNIDVSGGVYI